MKPIQMKPTVQMKMGVKGKRVKTGDGSEDR